MEEQIAKARVRVFVGRNLCAREKDGNNNLTEGGVGSQKAQEIGKSRQVFFWVSNGQKPKGASVWRVGFRHSALQDFPF